MDLACHELEKHNTVVIDIVMVVHRCWKASHCCHYYQFGGAQVQGIGMAPGLMHHLGQLSALQGLDVHGFEGVVSGYGMHRAAPPPLLPLSCCRQLRWLDISHWTVKGAEV